MLDKTADDFFWGLETLIFIPLNLWLKSLECTAAAIADLMPVFESKLFLTDSWSESSVSVDESELSSDEMYSCLDADCFLWTTGFDTGLNFFCFALLLLRSLKQKRTKDRSGQNKATDQRIIETVMQYIVSLIELYSLQLTLAYYNIPNSSLQKQHNSQIMVR